MLIPGEEVHLGHGAYLRKEQNGATILVHVGASGENGIWLTVSELIRLEYLLKEYRL